MKISKISLLILAVHIDVGWYVLLKTRYINEQKGMLKKKHRSSTFPSNCCSSLRRPRFSKWPKTFIHKSSKSAYLIVWSVGHWLIAIARPPRYPKWCILKIFPVEKDYTHWYKPSKLGFNCCFLGCSVVYKQNSSTCTAGRWILIGICFLRSFYLSVYHTHTILNTKMTTCRKNNWNWIPNFLRLQTSTKTWAFTLKSPLAIMIRPRLQINNLDNSPPHTLQEGMAWLEWLYSTVDGWKSG